MLNRYKQVSRGFSWGFRAFGSRPFAFHPLGQKPTPLADEALAIRAEPLGEVELTRSFGETAESDKSPRPTEVCVAEIGVLCE